MIFINSIFGLRDNRKVSLKSLNEFMKFIRVRVNILLHIINWLYAFNLQKLSKFLQKNSLKHIPII